jgi:hypothetical protein
MRVRSEWYRVGQYMISRRTVDLGIPNREDWAAYVAAKTGHRVSSKTIGNIERGQTFGSPKTRAALEAALGWMPGSCDAVAAGNEPTLREARSPDGHPRDDVNEEMLAHLHEQYRLLAEMGATTEEVAEIVEAVERMWQAREQDGGRYRRTMERFRDQVEQVEAHERPVSTERRRANGTS